MINDALLASYKLLSLDVFDTALLRDLALPTDIHTLVEDAYRRANPNISPFGYSTARIAAEAAARQRHFDRYGAEEIRFVDIFRALACPSDWDKSALANLELEFEERLARPNPAVRELAARAATLGIKTVFTSDMYLPATFIKQLLTQAGYAVGELFVSSEYLRTKSSGGLYRILLRHSQLLPHQILHIGDNLQSDNIAAARLGIATLHVQKNAALAERISPAGSARAPAAVVHRGRVNRLLGDVKATQLSFWQRVGIVHAAPLYLGFAQWLAGSLRRDGFQRVYFLARDGHIMRQVLQRVAPDIDSRYLYASRRALNIPSISVIDESALQFLTSGTARMRVRHYLERVGLESRRFAAAIKGVGFDHPEQEVTVGGLGRLRSLFQSLETEIAAIAAAERRILLQYLDQEGAFDSSRVAIVDLGWHGSLQESLSRVITLGNRNCEVQGYYFATVAAARERRARGHLMRAYFCENGEPSEHLSSIHACAEIFEFLHAAPHGTTVGFELSEGGTIRPRLVAYEAHDRQLAAVVELQTAALASIEDWLAEPTSRAIEVCARSAISELDRLLRAPTSEEARMLGDLEHVDGFGSALHARSLARPPSWHTILGDRKGAWQAYRSAYWREGFRSRLWGTQPAARRALERALGMASRLSAARRLIGLD